ncbi:unnamed protein product, partial [Chrysoparadoxa australica]
AFSSLSPKPSKALSSLPDACSPSITSAADLTVAALTSLVASRSGLSSSACPSVSRSRLASICATMASCLASRASPLARLSSSTPKSGTKAALPSPLRMTSSARASFPPLKAPSRPSSSSSF